ncbi:hypothetical protein UFOVP239_68 [uncultured Caudovirales phage]|uniref:DUF6321 domain-containing protein n=1 Tax=uncultured Caudovirales phage TaxID=2100421 RepID=A0A6J7WQ24_9CAUD|nr:hypothetical protein UFOVP239_68 [uncultured Caudovirales phage]
MPAKSKAQFRLMKAIEHNPRIAKKVGMSSGQAAEYTESNVAGKRYKKLPEHKAKGGPSLAVGRGEKLSVEKGAGLTEKGRSKYNRETGSHLKAPQPQGGSRRDSFCARMAGVVRHSKGDAKRAKASLKRWKCPSW